MGASDRIELDFEFVSSSEFPAICRREATAFTRRRKLTCDRLVATALSRKGRTMKMELREFEKVGVTEHVSAPGYLKAREKLNPNALLELARFHAKNFYLSEDVLDYKGYLLLSIDGSTFNVPTNDETIEAYGNASGQGKAQATCGISALFDSLNRQIINATMNRGTFDERSQVAIQLETVDDVTGDRPYILVMDRGYPSLVLMADLEDAGVPYVIRCYPNFLNSEFELASAKGGDVETKVDLSAKKRLGYIKRKNPGAYERLKSHAPLSARFLLIDIGNDTPELLVTNLPAEEFSAEDLKEIYHLRWNVETCFAMLKDKLQTENFTGTKPVLIEQDIFAAMYLLNVAYDLANEAERELRESGRLSLYKHEMAVNKSFAIGVVKEELLHVVLAPVEKRREMLEAVIEELKGSLVPVRKNRSYGRASSHSIRHNRYNNTHKRVF